MGKLFWTFNKRAEDLYVRPFASPAPTLKYYAPWNEQHYYPNDLLKNANGRCGAWARFFIDVLKVNGFYSSNPDVKNLLTLTSDGYTWMFVKKWIYSDTPRYGSLISGYPYSNLHYIGETGTPTKHDWRLEDVNDCTSLDDDNGKGQGPNDNPMSMFKDHMIVRYNGKYYDPSYGNVFNDIATLETNSISGYCLETKLYLNEANIYNPTTHQDGFDVDGENGIDMGDRYVFGIKKNPSGNQLKIEKEENY